MGQLANSFSRLIRRYGFGVDVVRIVNGTDVVVKVLAMRRYAEEEKLMHEISQDTVWFKLRTTELEEAGFPLPLKKGDRIKQDNVYYTAFVTRPLYDQDGIFGYEVRCDG